MAKRGRPKGSKTNRKKPIKRRIRTEQATKTYVEGIANTAARMERGIHENKYIHIPKRIILSVLMFLGLFSVNLCLGITAAHGYAQTHFFVKAVAIIYLAILVALGLILPAIYCLEEL